MDRAEKIGLGVAVAGHAALFALLSVGFLATPVPIKIAQQPVQVSLVKDVALEATAPAAEPPAQSVAPEQGAPDEAAARDSVPAPAPAPASKKTALPEPAPQPKPKPAPVEPAPVSRPVPKPVPPIRPVATPRPAPPKPAPAAKLQTPAKPIAKPAPAAPAKPAAKPAPVAPTRTASAAKPAAAAPTRTASTAKSASSSASAAKGSGTSATATAPRARGSRLGNDFLKGLTSDPSPSKAAAAAPAARIDARALAGIQDAISRQIQPCADRQVDPGPGANRIVTVLNLRLNENGTLAATPTLVRQTGVDDENDRYARRVVDLGIAAFKGCSPLRLPAEFFATPGGGWNNINYRWQLR